MPRLENPWVLKRNVAVVKVRHKRNDASVFLDASFATDTIGPTRSCCLTTVRTASFAREDLGCFCFQGKAWVRYGLDNLFAHGNSRRTLGLPEETTPCPCFTVID